MSAIQQMLIGGGADRNYIPTPVATPTNFGDALEGGFYAGLIWNEVVQSATSIAIGTGLKTFTVPDMEVNPLVYLGQTIEVRSRSNPNNKMIGTVDKALVTALTISVSSVGGSGTFTDWSIMSRYRVIVAPRASGENASIAFRNTNSDSSAIIGTLTEGRKATLAMVAADTSTVYPAAHWCNNLNIGGKTDWYLPARDELELCWRNLKATTALTLSGSGRPTTGFIDYKTLGSYGDVSPNHGLNNNSAPAGAAYTGGLPAQTTATDFIDGGIEAFTSGDYRTCTLNINKTWYQRLASTGGPGLQDYVFLSTPTLVRAVRRSII